MPKVITPLNNMQIQKAKPKNKNYTLADGDSLQLLIDTKGRKSWEFYYQSPTKHKRRKTSFGTFPKISLKEAREKKDTYKKLLFKDIDPIDHFKEKKKATSLSKSGQFNNVFNEWIEKQKPHLAQNTYERKKSLFEVDVLPFFENRNISTITHPEIVKLLENKSLNAPVVADRLFGYFNNLWKYATMKGYCNFNIIANIDKKTILSPTKQKHYSKVTDTKILKNLIQKIYTYDGHFSVKNALKLVLHIPLRASNLVELKWEYVDFNQKTITIPRGEMKVRNHNLPDYKIPITQEVINILQEQTKLSQGKEYVFISDNPNKPINRETPNRALERMGFNSEKDGNKQRLHSFRGTFRSLANTYQKEHNCSFEAKEQALDHTTKDVTERAYTNKSDYLEELKVLMNWWSNYILKLRKIREK